MRRNKLTRVMVRAFIRMLDNGAPEYHVFYKMGAFELPEGVVVEGRASLREFLVALHDALPTREARLLQMLADQGIDPQNIDKVLAFIFSFSTVEVIRRDMIRVYIDKVYKHETVNSCTQ